MYTHSGSINKTKFKWIIKRQLLLIFAFKNNNRFIQIFQNMWVKWIIDLYVFCTLKYRGRTYSDVVKCTKVCTQAEGNIQIIIRRNNYIFFNNLLPTFIFIVSALYYLINFDSGFTFIPVAHHFVSKAQVWEASTTIPLYFGFEFVIPQ